MNALDRLMSLSGRLIRWLTSVSGVLTVALLLPVASFLVAAWLYGWQLQAVLSGSMAPTYPVGSLLVVGSLDASQVAPGMPIVFEDPQQRGRLITHRVVGTAPGADLQFWTRGDANSARDAVPVPARMVRGRVLWSITNLGAVVTLVQGPWTPIVLVVLPLTALAVTELRAHMARRRNSATG